MPVWGQNCTFKDSGVDTELRREQVLLGLKQLREVWSGMVRDAVKLSGPRAEGKQVEKTKSQVWCCSSHVTVA